MRVPHLPFSLCISQQLPSRHTTQSRNPSLSSTQTLRFNMEWRHGLPLAWRQCLEVSKLCFSQIWGHTEMPAVRFESKSRCSGHTLKPGGHCLARKASRWAVAGRGGGPPLEEQRNLVLLLFWWQAGS